MKRNVYNPLAVFGVGIFYLFLYVPFVLLFIFSFNEDPFVFHWQGFTTRWYTMLFSLVEIRHAFYNSVVVALTSALLSLGMGTLFVCYATRRAAGALQPLFYAILVIPEIIVAVGFLGFCSLCGVGLGLGPLIIGHTLLGLGYV